MNRWKEILNLILNIILVICALVIVGLAGMNTFLKFGSYNPESSRSVMLEKPEETSHRLPEAMKIEGSGKQEDLKKIFEGLKTKRIRGFPIAIEFASVVTIGGRKMLLLPIIMKEPQLYGKLNFGLVNPIQWDSNNQLSECYVGRRSIWYMPVNSLMLYGILADPRLDFNEIGIGYILVKRISDDTYDVILQDNAGKILFASRGKLKKINPEIGEGTLIPLKNQEEVKKIYSPIWDIKPKDFILFCDTCN